LKTAIITGGTKGLGRELSLAFARAGYCVVALYSSDEIAAEKLSAELAKLGGMSCTLKHDVCSEESSVWNRPEIQNAEFLVLIHNACAAFTPVPMHQQQWRDFESNFSVAVKGAWICSQALIRLMLKKRGAIVNVLTTAIEGVPPKGFAAYVVAKSALEAFTLALAVEYAPRGIKIFSVSPGYMDTTLTNRWEPRLREIIRSNSTRVTLPPVAAERVVELVESSSVVGNGENHAI
jgi:3-oxoacyl-[acyl-carrier protein] reductase